jgi:hypothetical protein
VSQYKDKKNSANEKQPITGRWQVTLRNKVSQCEICSTTMASDAVQINLAKTHQLKNVTLLAGEIQPMRKRYTSIQ